MLDAFHAKTKAERHRRTIAQRSRYQALRAQGACGICGQPSRKAYCPACAAKAARRQRLKQLGITDTQYAQALLAQGAKCAICRTSQAKLKQALHADHDHATGAFRGLLCHRCNMGLGFFRDRQVLLRVAIRYLRGASRLRRAAKQRAPEPPHA